MTHRPTILQVLPALNSGGVERGTIEMAEAIAHVGWKSIVVSSGGRMLDELKRTRSEHITLPVSSKKPLTIWKNAKLLSNIIKQNNVSIVHARSRAPAWSAWMAAKRCKTPFITTFHGVYNFEGKWKKKYNSIMTKGDTVIAVSRYVRDHILEKYEIDPLKVKVIHRGVDLKTFNPEKVGAGAIEALSNDWHILEDHPPIILIPGRLSRWKGHEVLIRALAKIKDKDFICVMVGDDIGHEGYAQEMWGLIKTLGLEGKLRFAPNTRYMTEAYQLCDIVVIPSIEPEAFGRVPVEAQAMGKLVISTNHGGACETIIDKKTGFLVEPGNVNQLSHTLAESLDMLPQMRYDIGCAAMTHVYENFSADKMKEKTLELYQSYL